MDSGHSEYLKQRFQFESWPTGDDSEAAISGVRLEETELPGLRRLRVDAVPFAGARAAYQSMWASEREPETMIRLDLMETPDPASARELALTLLGEFQSADMQRSESGVGDLYFAMPGATSLLFTRRNVVVMLRNAGQEVVPMREFAQALDRQLTRKE